VDKDAMPHPEDPKAADEREAEKRFNETLGRMLHTPPKPHKPKPKPGGRTA
jgi:hypothetical protein